MWPVAEQAVLSSACLGGELVPGGITTKWSSPRHVRSSRGSSSRTWRGLSGTVRHSSSLRTSIVSTPRHDCDGGSPRGGGVRDDGDGDLGVGPIVAGCSSDTAATRPVPHRATTRPTPAPPRSSSLRRPRHHRLSRRGNRDSTTPCTSPRSPGSRHPHSPHEQPLRPQARGRQDATRSDPPLDKVRRRWRRLIADTRRLGLHRRRPPGRCVRRRRLA